MSVRRLAFALMLLLPALQACSGPAPVAAGASVSAPDASTAAPSPDAASSPAGTTAGVDVAPGDPHSACNLLTAADMSTFLGTAMVAVANDVTQDVSSCRYNPAGGRGPSAEFTVSRGDGAATLRAEKAMAGHDASADSAYQGIGDDAVVLGPAVTIRHGEDLLVFTLVGVGDGPGTVRKLFDTAKARM
ncbi:DUF3558 family protein [Cognatiluteimonas profundi]|uniref:DUF3558 family protein n=1 Tax=Cognatiluteimonas profundi TaxID=2594501 RepID=UPI00131D658E|nr:DUF3558 family protein [Lysobacter profundi]